MGNKNKRIKAEKAVCGEQATSFLCCQTHIALTCGFNACVDSALWGYKRGFYISVLQI